MFKVFIVEDEYLVRERLVKSINWESIDCKVIGYSENGLNAVKFIHINLPDIVITDIRMPKMNGLELSEYVSKKFPQIKIIIITGYCDFVYAQKAIRVGVKDYIIKPSNKKEILDAVVNVINQIKCTNKEECEKKFIYEDKVLLKNHIIEAVEYINQNFSEDISLTKVAEHIHIHPVYLGRLFRQELKISFTEFVIKIRIDNAKEIFKKIDIKTYEVSQRVGISDPRYFSQLFKKYTGLTPTEYKESLKKKYL